METVIKVTKGEADHADWAIGGMQDVAGTEDFGYEEVDLPLLRGSELVFPTSSTEAADDFLFRIEDQLKDMIYDEYGYGDAFRPKLLPKGAAELKSSKSLARKVRARFPKENPNSVLSQIAVNTTQDIVLAALGVGIIGGVLYLIYKKSTDVGSDVGYNLGQSLANFVSSTSTSLFPGAGQRSESTTPYGDTAELGPGASVQGGAEAAGVVPGA